VDEAYLAGETPAQHVERLARGKAEAIALELPLALVIGGDTVVVDGARVMGKPRSDAHAVEMLMGLSGREHHVLSGVAIVGPFGTVSRVASTEVRFREFDERTALAYVATGEPADKAGAYGIQGMGAALVEEIRGDYYCVVGFPVAALLELFAEAGWRYVFGRLEPVD
jgi:septum formation protein